MNVRGLYATVIKYTCGSEAIICRSSLAALEAEVEKHKDKPCPLCQLEDGTITEEGFLMLAQTLEAELEEKLENIARSN